MLDEDERAEAARASISFDKQARRRLAAIVAEARNFRRQTVRAWPDPKLIAAVCKCPLRDPNHANQLLHHLHVPGRKAMVTTFLDALSLDHNEGAVDSFREIDATSEAVRSATLNVGDIYGWRRVVLYLLTLRLHRSPAGVKGCDWLLQVLEEPDDVKGAGPRIAVAPVPSTDDIMEEEEADPARDDHTRQRSFTTLDRMLILSAVDTAQGVEGALSQDELDDVVDELVTLNGRRHQSYFHAGFRDVLFDKPLAREMPAENRSRLGWYWTGVIQGWARRQQWDRIVREHANNPVVSDLGSGSNTASTAAVPHVVEALRREGRSARIARYVKVPALLAQPGLFKLVFDAASELLEKGDAASALPIFERLLQAYQQLDDMGAPVPPRPLLDTHRRMAHCLRHLHQHGRARKVLMDLLETDPDPNIQAMVQADIGLLEGGFASLDEVVLPQRRDELDGVLERLTAGLERYRKSAAHEGAAYSAHGHYCLGVLALGRGRYDRRFEKAEQHLEQARVGFSKSVDSYTEDLTHRASLYYGLAKAQRLESHKLAHAADVIVQALTAGSKLPEYLVEPTVVALTLADKADLRLVVNTIISVSDEKTFRALAICRSALEHCPALCDELLARGHEKGRFGRARARELHAALDGYVAQRNREGVRNSLDGLEHLARNQVGVREFLELLDDPTRYEDAWDPDDVAVARASCLEARGEYQEAMQVLREMFHRVASPEREGGQIDAAGVLERIGTYPIDPGEYRDLTGRYDALAAASDETDLEGDEKSTAPVKILVIGGGEEEARKDNAVRTKVKDRDPRIRVSFIRPGWSGNWTRAFGKVENRMKDQDALVIMRFMRTNLGREIRRQWSGPWRSCWSRGHGGIVEAVLDAARAARHFRTEGSGTP